MADGDEEVTKGLIPLYIDDHDRGRIFVGYAEYVQKERTLELVVDLDGPQLNQLVNARGISSMSFSPMSPGTLNNKGIK